MGVLRGDAVLPVASAFRRYGVAAVCAVVALAMRAALDSILGTTLPFLTLFAAVALAVWYGGYAPALVTTILGYLGANFFFIEPRGVLLVGLPEFVGLLGYLAACGVIILFGELLHRARSRAEASGREAPGAA